MVGSESSSEPPGLEGISDDSRGTINLFGGCHARSRLHFLCQYQQSRYSCNGQRDIFRSTQAFYILFFIGIIASIALTAVALVKRLVPKVPIHVIVMAVALFFGVIAWATSWAAVAVPLCNSYFSYLSSGSVGASPILVTLSWFFVLVAFILALLQEINGGKGGADGMS